MEWPTGPALLGRWSPLRLRAAVTLVSCLTLSGLLILRSWQLNQFEHCVSVMEVLEGDPQLSKISQALDASGLAGYFGDKQLGATFFAPTDDAIKKSKWEDCTADDPRLLGSLLYHSVPMKVDLSKAPMELPTNLGKKDILSLQPRSQSELQKGQALAMVAPVTQQFSWPSRVTKTLETCKGAVYMIDATLEPDEESLGPTAVKNSLLKLADDERGYGDLDDEADAFQQSWRSKPNRGFGELKGRKERTQKRLRLQPSSLQQAIDIARKAAEEHAREDAELDRKNSREEEEMRRQEEEEEQRKREEEDLLSPGGAAQAVLKAEEAQVRALAAAQSAFQVAEGMGDSFAADKAQDWLAAAEYAVEGVTFAKEAASWSGADASLSDQAHGAAQAAMLLAEVSLAQHTAVALARTADWGSSLLGSTGSQVLKTEAGDAWADAATEAHSAALKASAAAGSLATSIAAKAQAQGVLGSRVASKQQSSDTATLDAIKALAQKLPPSERSSLNALLAAALKQGDSSVLTKARIAGSKMKKQLQPGGSWSAAARKRRGRRQENDLVEDGSVGGFDSKPTRPAQRSSAKLQIRSMDKTRKSGSSRRMPSTGSTAAAAAAEEFWEQENGYDEAAPEQPDEETESPADFEDTSHLNSADDLGAEGDDGDLAAMHAFEEDPEDADPEDAPSKISTDNRSGSTLNGAKGRASRVLKPKPTSDTGAQLPADEDDNSDFFAPDLKPEGSGARQKPGADGRVSKDAQTSRRRDAALGASDDVSIIDELIAAGDGAATDGGDPQPSKALSDGGRGRSAERGTAASRAADGARVSVQDALDRAGPSSKAAKAAAGGVQLGRSRAGAGSRGSKSAGDDWRGGGGSGGAESEYEAADAGDSSTLLDTWDERQQEIEPSA